VAIERFMSEGRAVTNFTGNAVATLLIGRWTRQIDVAQVRAVLSGERPYLKSMLAGTDGYGTSIPITTPINTPITSPITAATTLIVEGSKRQPVKAR